MTAYCLEMRSTANWQDVRYRDYTTSERKAEAFRKVPKVQFTDSGHGIVPSVREHRGRREPKLRALADHVNEAMAGLPKQRQILRLAPLAKVEALHALLHEALPIIEAASQGRSCAIAAGTFATKLRAALNIHYHAREKL